MTQEGVPKDDVKVPEGELGAQISSDFESGKDLLVTIVSAMGEEQVCLINLSISLLLCEIAFFFFLVGLSSV